MIFFNGFCQNNWSLGHGGLSKIRSLQCYEVLWIHNIDAICTSNIEGNYDVSTMYSSEKAFHPLKKQRILA